MFGVFIVLEGPDGCGKGEQTRRLVERLEALGQRVVQISFPQYGKKSAGLVEEYLNGKYGHNVGPHAASIFFAADRFDKAVEIRQLLAEGCVVVADRYVDSNAGHQGSKISDDEERKRFLAWLYDLEYCKLGVPKPDRVLILHVPARIGYGLVLQKQKRAYLEGGKKQDIHEADIRHLEAAEASYLWLARQYPDEHVLIECMDGERLLPPEEVSKRVWAEVKNLLE